MSTSNFTKPSRIRTTIETAFYGNNVKKVISTSEAYKLASKSPGTVCTDMPIYKPEHLGLDIDSKVLLFNDGSTTGRCADARRIIGENGVSTDAYASLLRDAIFNSRNKIMYYTQSYIGLDTDFMVKAHLLVPQGYENILYNWLMNFQPICEKYKTMYEDSISFPDEGDIFIFSDPDWQHVDFPDGLSLFDPINNCVALLGLKYFGEHKKGTLTLAWGIGNRKGYIACHGGLKRYNNNNFIVGVFGLSGSGKSTITHDKHYNKYDVSILHDDAFLLSTLDGSAVALEPSYFDKTQDYPAESPDNKYLITAQNCGATINNSGECILVTEDIRNGNGRAIKSKLWAPNRVDKFDEPANVIIWLMKDPTLPPVIRINDPCLSATMGATLATKRSSAEKIVNDKDIDSIVIEPYANPFRTYPLADDYNKFKSIFANNKVDCYIFNTGSFINKKVTKDITISSLEKIVENTAEFSKWDQFSNISIMNIEGYKPDMNDLDYVGNLLKGFEFRIDFLKKETQSSNNINRLPDEAIQSLQNVVTELKKSLLRNVVA